MLAGPCGDWLGRRGTILVGCIIFLIGGGLQTGAQSLGYLWSGRCLAGAGVGFLVMVCGSGPFCVYSVHSFAPFRVPISFLED